MANRLIFRYIRMFVITDGGTAQEWGTVVMDIHGQTRGRVASQMLAAINARR